MLNKIQINQGALYQLYDLSQGSFIPTPSSPTLLKIKEFVVDLFAKIRSKLTNVDNQSNEFNLKPLAMIMFISLIAMMVLSLMRNHNSRLIAPPTPKPKHKELETDLEIETDLTQPEIDLLEKK